MVSQTDSANNTNLAIKLVAYSALTVLVLAVLYKLHSLIVSLIMAITLASAIAPAAKAGEKKKIPRLATVFGIYITIALIYTMLVAAVIPAIKEQAQTLSSTLPAYVDHFEQWSNDKIGTNTLKPSTDNIKSFAVGMLGQTANITASFVELVLNGLLILFLAAYFATEADLIWPALLKWLPADARSRYAEFIGPLEERMGGYVRGQLMVAVVVGIFLFIGFTIIGLKYALLLGALAGLLNLIPYLGSLSATIIAVIVAFNQDPILAGAVLIVYGIEQWFESSLIVPFFVGRSAALHPLIVLLAIIIGATLMGVAGALISVPVASAALYIAEQLYLHTLAPHPSSS